jgi:hypothetical protein
MPGVLYARVDGAWVPVSSGSAAGNDEVWVGPGQPADTYELWVDTDEIAPITNDVRWNTAWGTQRIFKTADQGGFGTTEAVVAGGFTGFVPAAVDARYTSISYGLIIPTITSPPGESWVYVRCRLGATAGGTLIDSNVHPFRTGQQNIGAGTTAFQGEFFPAVFAAGATASLTFQTGTGITTVTIAGQSWLSIQDRGPVTAGVPPLNPTPPWISMGTLLNGWVNYTAADPPPAYRKYGDMVQIRGAIKNAATMTSPSQSYIFTLPVGFRPAYTNAYPAIQAGSDTWGAGGGVVTVDNVGRVGVIRSASTPSQPHLYTAFDFSYSVTP